MRNHRALLFLLTAALVAVKAPAPAAQNNCQAFRAIAEGQFLSPYPTLNAALNVWGGTVFASLGTPGAQTGQVPLVGVFSGADADDYQTDSRPRPFGGMGLHGSYTFAFGDPAANWQTYANKFTVSLGRAVWNFAPALPWPDGQIAGDYQASGLIAGGTGRFEGTTGSITIQGPFFDALMPSNDEIARWTPEINGVICGVK